MATDPVFRPPPGNPRFPLIDSLRAIAALSVLISHAFYLTGESQHAWFGAFTARLDCGVAIFFVISGFLLYRPFVSARLNGGRAPTVRDYARRRVLRIVPAYWLALTVLAIYPGLPQMWSSHSWAYYTFVQIYHPYWPLGGIVPAWSLSVEVSFYVLLPLVALFLAHSVFAPDRRSKIQSEVAFLACLAVAGLLFRAFDPSSYLQQSLLGMIAWFIPGMLLAVASAALEGRKRKPAAVRLVEDSPLVPWVIAAVLYWIVSKHAGLSATNLSTRTDAANYARHVLYGPGRRLPRAARGLRRRARRLAEADPRQPRPRLAGTRVLRDLPVAAADPDEGLGRRGAPREWRPRGLRDGGGLPDHGRLRDRELLRGGAPDPEVQVHPADPPREAGAGRRRAGGGSRAGALIPFVGPVVARPLRARGRQLGIAPARA